MIELLIIADDFTGALDTGVQFTKRGAKTCVVTDPDIDYTKLDADVKVLSLDAETRHLDAGQAYEVVARVVRAARRANVPYIYKKTDSALRGNIGAELAALCEEAGETVHFVPAFPQCGRTTKNGIHYVDGIPVGESVFGEDPYEPVRHSAVKDIIAEQTRIKTTLADGMMSDTTARKEAGIVIFDAETPEQLDAIAKRLEENGGLHVSAGCAGLASRFAGILGYTSSGIAMPKLPEKLLVACGSVNPITVAQLARAEQEGCTRIHLKAEEKLDAAWLSSAQAEQKLEEWLAVCGREEICILDSNDEKDSGDTMEYASAHGLPLETVRVRIASAVGEIVKNLLDRGLSSTLLVTGGDTLMGFMHHIGVSILVPICEPITGVVLSGFCYNDEQYYIISKSGGFGGTTLIRDLMTILKQEKENVC
ncbi:MAG: four-carbon acid sugar kinase family protein [Lachnospiraceae bacterium]|nr:four-carbon acid sugar kinase family protein [Lachnospiraceae bacterium]